MGFEQIEYQAEKKEGENIAYEDLILRLEDSRVLFIIDDEVLFTMALPVALDMFFRARNIWAIYLDQKMDL